MSKNEYINVLTAGVLLIKNRFIAVKLFVDYQEYNRVRQ
jgi:hypothetical protein